MIIILALILKLLNPLVFCLRSEVLMTVDMKRVISWDVAPCSLVEVYHVSEKRIASIFDVEKAKHASTKQQVEFCRALSETSPDTGIS
jgi:hypothetical protein